jgi:heptosyltransferase II
MKILIIKLGATGDVVRTTPLLNVLDGEIHWLTSDLNKAMLYGNQKINTIIPWTQHETLIGKNFNMVVNLEDDLEAAALIRKVSYDNLHGAYLNDDGKMTYTKSLSDWFDLSLISRFGKNRADELKLHNRRTYQDMLFRGLGYCFSGQRYYLPPATSSDIVGDIAIAPDSGVVWPMKKWAYYKELKIELEHSGYKVNNLQIRKTVSEHIQDVRNHRYLVSGDSLPMHIALGSQIKCLSLFICTSPYEIDDYGVQKKIISPLLAKNFYKRNYSVEATQSIRLEEVYETVVKDIERG